MGGFDDSDAPLLSPHLASRPSSLVTSNGTQPPSGGQDYEALADASGFDPMSPLDVALAQAATWLDRLASRGPDLRINAHRKAAHEAQEFAEEPCVEEFADVVICLVGAAVHHGWSESEIAKAIMTKVAINSARTWAQKPDGTWQHTLDPATDWSP